MKRNASFISISGHLAKWLYEKMQELSSDETARIEINDFKESMADLLKGDIDNLILELSTEDSLEKIEIAPIDAKLCFGDLTIFPKSRKVLRKQDEINLTPKEFDILYFLAKNKGEVFTKEQIYQAVWADEYLLSDNNIMAFIRKLRKKIELQPDNPEYILTIWGIGYKFNEKL